MRERRAAIGAALAACALTALTALTASTRTMPLSRRAASAEPAPLDPAAWGSDHVDKPLPDYTTGDSCLFCHRQNIGARWSENRHNLTIRPFAEDSPARRALSNSPARRFADQIEYVLGNERQQRFLRRAKAYGKLELLSIAWIGPRGERPGRLESPNDPRWDETTFADSCAGCHATAVDPKQKAFSSPSLDCFVCHGTIPAEHSKQPELTFFSPKRDESPRVAVSICAQCHVRTGKSKSSGRPYPTNFVAGDNLFRDFQVDLSQSALDRLNPADRHVLQNVRDVVLLGDESMTCLSCHDLHGQSSQKHKLAADGRLCLTCHRADSKEQPIRYEVHSRTCGY